MTRSVAGLCSTLVLMTVLAACGGTSTQPVSSATPASSTSTPSPSVPTEAEDVAALKQAIVTAADLGKPWIQPEKVPTAGKSTEACPGKRSATERVTTVASIRRDLAEGKGKGVNIGTFRLGTLPSEDATDLRAAYAEDIATCKTFTDANDLFVVYSEEGPEAADRADEILMARAERIYYDKAHKKLAYARHSLAARTGRVVTYVSYAFLTTKQDPNAEDFTRTLELLDIQLAKVSEAFPA